MVIVDYGMGNLRSIHYKLQKLDIQATISSKPDIIEQADGLILPGVGHFGKGMENLRELDLIPILNWKVLEQKTPVMGICLGMQLFTEKSEEGNASGLGWIASETKRFRFEGNKDLRVPHVGWNTLSVAKDSSLLDGVGDDQRFYFTHSYYVACRSTGSILATTYYGIEFVSALQQENIFGTQFHPEKSHRRGIEVIRNFVKKL